ncbi:MAG: hypothetical protein EOP04_14595 [Proteobacteria bacterium]|nr:MAG: hypothetical protein EOP04_14595 [Pseudomonadota bacterium]
MKVLMLSLILLSSATVKAAQCSLASRYGTFAEINKAEGIQLINPAGAPNDKFVFIVKILIEKGDPSVLPNPSQPRVELLKADHYTISIAVAESAKFRNGDLDAVATEAHMSVPKLSHPFQLTTRGQNNSSSVITPWVMLSCD